jgi:tetratricopeptide (TPR) repeat protein
MKPDDADILDSRGFVFLRLGRLERAIADYDAVLKQRPKLASALYGRGLARIGRGDRAGGQEDVTAARAVDPDVVAAFARYGVR